MSSFFDHGGRAAGSSDRSGANPGIARLITVTTTVSAGLDCVRASQPSRPRPQQRFRAEASQTGSASISKSERPPHTEWGVANTSRSPTASSGVGTPAPRRRRVSGHRPSHPPRRRHRLRTLQTVGDVLRFISGDEDAGSIVLIGVLHPEFQFSFRWFQRRKSADSL